MSKHWEFIAQCLRAELADYGGLLHLFEAQQRSLFNRDPDAVLRFANEIESLRARAASSETLATEISTLKDQRDVIRTRVGEMLDQLEALNL